jgi:hypothetical protein
MMERGQTTWSSEPLLPWRVVLCVLLEHMIIDPLSAACYSSGVLSSISRCCPRECAGMRSRFWLETDMCRRSRNTLTCAGISRPIFFLQEGFGFRGEGQRSRSWRVSRSLTNWHKTASSVTPYAAISHFRFSSFFAAYFSCRRLM